MAVRGHLIGAVAGTTTVDVIGTEAETEAATGIVGATGTVIGTTAGTVFGIKDYLMSRAPPFIIGITSNTIENRILSCGSHMLERTIQK